MNTIEDLGCTTSIELINRFLKLAGSFLIDAGCGSMEFTRPLVEHGARVLAIDPDPIQAKLNRDAPRIANLDFIETGAEHLPVGDHTVDGMFFSYSLHHIPADLYPRVFAEALRVLRPDGFLCVIEPMSCPLNEVMKLFHDEDDLRAAAQEALRVLAVPAFKSVRSIHYHSYTRYESFDHFADHYSSRSFNTRYTAADVRRPAVKAAFERHAPEYRFQSPKLAVFLREFREAAQQRLL